MTPDLPARVGVAGGGRMGAGIAHAFLISGCEVVIVEQNAPAARAARDRVARSIAASIERGLTADARDLMAGLRVTTESADLAGADLAVEAVPEDRDRKSTRLDSSHVSSSYAVFCLEKKKVEMIQQL